MSDHTKYPRTPHLRWSPGYTEDDIRDFDAEAMFGGREVVMTEKLDGECTSFYSDGYTHARSVDSAHHPSRAWVKAEAARVARDIPSGWRVVGENAFAEHSIRYDRLPSYFLVFGIYDETNNALPWVQVEEWCALLDLRTVPVLYRGLWNEETVKASFPSTSAFGPTPEGYVVRLADGFKFADFGRSVAKWVRKNHVQTSDHWMFDEIKPNGLDASPQASSMLLTTRFPEPR